MFYVYVLQSLKDKSLYIGYTSNLKKRFVEHNNGLSTATKHKRPYTLIFLGVLAMTSSTSARGIFNRPSSPT